jgi:hypothetical protein
MEGVGRKDSRITNETYVVESLERPRAVGRRLEPQPRAEAELGFHGLHILEDLTGSIGL